jgi:hypothetical protein
MVLFWTNPQLQATTKVPKTTSHAFHGAVIQPHGMHSNILQKFLNGTLPCLGQFVILFLGTNQSRLVPRNLHM